MSIIPDYTNKKIYPVNNVFKDLDIPSKKTSNTPLENIPPEPGDDYSLPEPTIYMPEGDMPYKDKNITQQKVFESLELNNAIYIQAADLINLISVQNNSVKTLTEIQNDLLMQLNSVFSIIGNLATSEYNYITIQENKAIEQQKEAAKKSGVLATLIGVVETLVGVGLCVVSGGANPIGVFLIIDGITRIVSGSIAFFKPDLAMDQWLTSFEQAGLAGIFNVFGENGAMIAQVIFMAIMAIATCGASLAASGIQFGVNFIASLLLVVSTGFSLYGMIKGIIDQVKSKEIDGVNSAQAASAGLLAWLLYTILKETGVQKIMEDKYGKNNAMLIEMAIFTVAGIASGSANLVNRSLAGNKLLNGFMDIIKSGLSQITSKIDSFSTEIKLAERYQNLNANLEKFANYINQNIINKLNNSIKNLNSESFNKLVITGNAVNNLSQLAINVMNLLKTKGEEELQKTEADLRFYEELTNLRKQLINLEATLIENTQTGMGQEISQIVDSINSTVNVLSEIMMSAIQYNPFKA